MLLCCIPCFLVINLRFIRGCTRTISTNLCFFLVYQLNIFPFNFCFVNYSVVYKSKGETKDIELVEEEQAQIGADPSSGTSNKSENYKEEAQNAIQKHKPKKAESVNADAEAFAEPLEHTKKRDTGHQSVSLENKTGDSTVLKIGNSTKVVIKQDMKGRGHKYGFNNNKREKAEKKRMVDDETGDKHQLDELQISFPPQVTRQLTQQIRDQLEESITEKVTRQVMASFSQLQSQMQSQGLAVPLEPLVGRFGPRVSTKGSCVDPSGNDPKTGDSDRCGLYIEADPARLVAMGRVYEGSAVVHNTPLLPGQVKVSVEKVTNADALVPVPTDEVSLVGQALHTFLVWPTHLVAVSPAKPPPKPDPEVDDPLYLMTLTIPELFLRPYQVIWDAIVFGVVNPDFPLYIKHEDLSEIAHGGQCLSISVHLTETCMRVGNSDIYGFLEPQSIQRFHCSGHWQMVVILPKEHLVVWPDNYLKGIINSAIKGLDDAPQPKSKASARWIVVKCNRQKGSTECGYYVMHWMSTIILGTFRNNWEAYFNNPRSLEPQRLKALWIQWAQFFLRVRDQA
ncbi:hypothetical protein HKD37_03G006775 [Glycine soja]